MSQFLAELKRRRVVRAALVYVGAAFVVLEAADLLVEAFQLPALVFSIIGIASVVGLPVAVVLAWAFDIGPADAATRADGSPAPPSWLTVRSVVAVVALVAFGVFLGLAPQYLLDTATGVQNEPVRRYEILLPEDAPIEFIGSAPLAVPTVAMAITPDGGRLVYAGSADEGGTRLYVRELSQFDVRSLPGSEGAYAPFISPDGQWVGFFAQDQLRIVPIDGGDARVLAETPNPRGGAWWGNDRILYNDRESNADWWVSVTGGSPTRLAVSGSDSNIGQTPEFGYEYQPLPDGQRFLVVDTGSGQVAAYAPSTGDLKTVMDIPVNVRVASDALVYSFDNDLFALDFDPLVAMVSGDPRLVGSGLRRDDGLAQFVVSDRTLIYATGAPYGQRYLALVNAEGNGERLNFPAARYFGASFSPDGSQLAITISENQRDIWIYDMKTLERRRLTRGGNNMRPHWSSDGETIYFSSNRHGEGDNFAIYRTRSTAAPGDGQLLLQADNDLFIDQLNKDDVATVLPFFPGRDNDLYVVDLHKPALEPAAGRPDVSEVLGELSPDGRWLALTSDASGRYEVIVQSVDAGAERYVQITTEGGEEPTWAPDMRRIFYRNGRTLYSVPISLDGDRPVIGRPQSLFEDPTWANILGYSYWPNPADGRFLILRADQPPAARSLRVIEGWKRIGRE